LGIACAPELFERLPDRRPVADRQFGDLAQISELIAERGPRFVCVLDGAGDLADRVVDSQLLARAIVVRDLPEQEKVAAIAVDAELRFSLDESVEQLDFVLKRKSLRHADFLSSKVKMSLISPPALSAALICPNTHGLRLEFFELLI
jgi:hypothetical protein